jgi:ribosomal protein S4E
LSKVFVGNVNTATIDIGDIKALNGKIATSAGALIHETWEQYMVQVKDIDATTAHVKATKIESSVIGYNMEPFKREIDYTNNCIRVESGTKYSNRKIDLSKSNCIDVVNFKNNNVINVIEGKRR